MDQGAGAVVLIQDDLLAVLKEMVLIFLLLMQPDGTETPVISAKMLHKCSWCSIRSITDFMVMVFLFVMVILFFTPADVKVILLM